MTVMKEAPEGARVLDLEAQRIARAEALEGEPYPVVKLSAGFVELKREADLTAAENFAEGDLRAGLAKLLRDPADAAALIEGGFSNPDLSAIMRFISGRSLGE